MTDASKNRMSDEELMAVAGGTAASTTAAQTGTNPLLPAAPASTLIPVTIDASGSLITGTYNFHDTSAAQAAAASGHQPETPYPYTMYPIQAHVPPPTGAIALNEGTVPYYLLPAPVPNP